MDTQLVIRAQEGDEAAFAELTTAIGGRLNRIAYSILRDRALAEDAAQQGLIDIWRKLPRLRDPARFEAWSYRFVVHACYAEARRARSGLREIIRSEPEAPDDLSLVDDRDQLERGFKRLSVEQRAVVVLRHYAGMPLREVAETLGVAEGTAHSRYDRAMRRLRTALDPDHPARDAVPQEVLR